jgi:hypothetical protein
LRRIREAHPDADLEFILAAYIPTDGPHSAVPNLTLDKDLLARLSSLGVDFVLDYSLLAPEDQETSQEEDGAH